MKNPVLIIIWLCLGAGFFALSLVPNLVYMPPFADKMLHINAYALFVILPMVFLKDVRYALGLAVILFMIGIGMEFAQTLVSGRNASLEDALANAAGIGAGLIIGGLYRAGLKKPVMMIALVLTTFAFSPNANAQYLTREDDVVSVADRKDEHFDAIGGQLGAFKVNPGIEVEQRFDDNIYRTTTNTQSDEITEFRPSLTVSPDWAAHDLTFTGGAEIGRYWDKTNENYEDFGAQLSGRYDFDIGTNVRFLTGYTHLHEDRGSPDDPDGDTPVEYDVVTTQIGAARELGILKLRLAAQNQTLRFENTTKNSGVIDNGVRDRDVQTISTRLAYELSPATEIFTVPSYTWTDYKRSGVGDRSSQGYEITLGAAHDITGKLHTDLYIGYFSREMDNAIYKDVDGAKYGGSLLWNITDITSLKGSLGRQLRETTQTNASGYVQTNAALALEHALTYRTLLDGGVGWANFNFEGNTTGTDREDDIFQANVNGKYKLFRGAAVEAGYTYTDRSSNVAGVDYENNIFNVTLGYAY